MTKIQQGFSSLISFIAVCSLMSVLCAQAVEQNTISTGPVVYPTWLNVSETEYNQYLADTYNYFITPSGNRVWACGMSLAWNQLKRGILNGQNPAFLNVTPLQQKLVDNLNSQLFKKSELSDDSYYVTSGFGPSVIERINLQVRQKFPAKTFMPLNFTLEEKDFVSYAYLYKNFKFQKPFTKIPSYLFKGKYVEGFEASSSKMKNQIYYKYYNHQDDFMIGLETVSPNDEILLWKTNQTGVNDAKFDKIMNMIMFYNSLQSTKLSRLDKFSMPAVDLQYDRNYKEMINAKFINPGFQGYQISEMTENIKLRLTHAGVTLENQAIIRGFRSGFFGGKFFILDSDFWLIMKEKNKLPYLVTLVRQVSQENKI